MKYCVDLLPSTYVSTKRASPPSAQSFLPPPSNQCSKDEGVLMTRPNNLSNARVKAYQNKTYDYRQK